MGCDGDSYEVDGIGSRALGAFENLKDNLKQMTGVEIEDSDLIDLLEVALTAVATPGARVERRDFSTPESNYDLIYEVE